MSDAGYSRVYPYNTEEEHGHAQLRTHNETLKYGSEVDDQYQKSNKSTAVPKCGVKGRTVLTYLPKFDVIRGTTVDYMQCIYRCNKNDYFFVV